MDEKRMSDLNPYEQLKVAEDASFEDIQTARDRLLKVYQGDEQTRQQVEIAYDSILMDRLRQRQEGKIKVPEGIRFAERLTNKPAKSAKKLPANPSLSWVQRTMDVPSSKEVTLLAGIYVVLAGIGILSQQGSQADPNTLSFLLTIGFGLCVYWINRKENQLGRAFLLSVVALIVGGLVGIAFWQGFQGSGLITEAQADVSVVTVVVFFIFWLVSSFLR